VHHDAQGLATFDFVQFATQLWRAQLVWLVYIGQMLKLRIPTETLFKGR
jgi:hypothetical protein